MKRRALGGFDSFGEVELDSTDASGEYRPRLTFSQGGVRLVFAAHARALGEGLCCEYAGVVKVC